MKIDFFTDGNIMRAHDAAIVLAGDDPRETLVEQVIHNIATDVMVKVSGVEMHLAAWTDPDHWEDDWREVGVEDVDAFLAKVAAAREP